MRRAKFDSKDHLGSASLSLSLSLFSSVSSLSLSLFLSLLHNSSHERHGGSGALPLCFFSSPSLFLRQRGSFESETASFSFGSSASRPALPSGCVAQRCAWVQWTHIALERESVLAASGRKEKAGEKGENVEIFAGVSLSLSLCVSHCQLGLRLCREGGGKRV